MSIVKKKLQTLAEHIREEYDGNQSECARAYGVERNQVKQWLNAVKTVCVLDDGCLISVIKEPKSPYSSNLVRNIGHLDFSTGSETGVGCSKPKK